MNQDILEKEYIIQDLNRLLNENISKSNQQDQYKNSVKDLENEVAHLKSSIEDIGRRIQQTQPNLKQKEIALHELKQVFAKKETEMTDSIHTLQNAVSQVKSFEPEIQSYVDRHIEEQLTACLNEIKQIEQATHEINNRLDQLNEQHAQFQKQESEIQLLQRHISDNIEYRRMDR